MFGRFFWKKAPLQRTPPSLTFDEHVQLCDAANACRQFSMTLFELSSRPALADAYWDNIFGIEDTIHHLMACRRLLLSKGNESLRLD